VNAPVSTQRYEVLKTLGDCYAAQDQFDRARACYREAADLAPGMPGHQVGLGVVNLLEGNAAEARAAFEAVLQAAPNCPEAIWGMALVHWQEGDFAQASQKIAQCAGILPDHWQVVWGLFHACKKLGDFSPVAKFLEARLQKHPGDTRALLCQAQIQLAAGDPQAARQTLLTIQALDPANAPARQMLAELPAPISNSGPARPAIQ
jgi:Flp pilus assembly protein TadD